MVINFVMLPNYLPEIDSNADTDTNSDGPNLRGSVTKPASSPPPVPLSAIPTIVDHDDLSNKNQHQQLDFNPQSQIDSPSFSSPAIDMLHEIIENPSKYVIVEARNGLGNRLRVVAGGLGLASSTNRRLILSWPLDEHCNATFGSLFNTEKHEVWFTYDTFFPDGLLPKDKFNIHDCLKDKKSSTKHQKIQIKSEQGVFIRSAYGLSHVEGDFKKSYHFLRKLRPHENILSQLIDPKTTRYYGVHCRSKIYDGVVSKAVESGKYVNANDALINYMGKKTAYTTIVERRSSKWEFFVAAMKEILEVDPTAKFFVAADNEEAYAGFKQIFGSDKILYTKRDIYSDTNRGSSQLQPALTDMINLGRSLLILGSSGSSFTDVASTFGSGDGKTKVKRVGNDFGKSICVQHDNGVYDIEPEKNSGMDIIELLRDDTRKKVREAALQNEIDYGDSEFEKNRRREHANYQEKISKLFKDVWDNGSGENFGWPATFENNTGLFLPDYVFYRYVLFNVYVCKRSRTYLLKNVT